MNSSASEAETQRQESLLGEDVPITPLPSPPEDAVLHVMTPASPATDQLPARIEGLDMVIGLRRVLGKQSLYLSLLRKFVSGQKHVFGEIHKALENDSWELAERLAHTLKGVAGNIGATHLPQLAQTLETTIRERCPPSQIDAQLGELGPPLAHLVAQLERQLPPMPLRTIVTVDPEKLAGICDTLEGLLIEDNAEAVDVLETNADLLKTAFPMHFRQIEAGVHSCRFEDSLTALRLAIKTGSALSLLPAS